MGKRDDIKAQIDELTKEYNATDDDDLELDIERDGYKAKVRGRHARKVLRKLGLDDDDDGQGDAKDADGKDGADPKDGGKDGADGKDDAPKPGNRYFR